DVSTHHRLQPLAQFGDGFVHSSVRFGFQLVQLRLQPFSYHLAQHRIHSVASLLHADVRKAQGVELLWPPSPRLCRLLIANGPNSSSHVFSGRSSRLNFFLRSVSSARNDRRLSTLV